MPLPTISINNLSKKYRLFNNPKDRFFEALHPFRKLYHKEFWALKDITFDISKGQTIGIIGRNGSGKSTLLQIICSVLRPTSGQIHTEGRISAILALGAGFNPEFTGRENVLTNGMLIGLSKAEMKKRMPEIEAFAEIGQFIDQPIKTYSSGMSLRLAFATAINVDPDILVIDEAIAVGDAKFQQKCYRKFHEFQKAGKTIVFVTHDMNAVIRNCDKAILLDSGCLAKMGQPKDIVDFYINLIQNENPSNLQNAIIAKKSSADTFLKKSKDASAVSKINEFLKSKSDFDNCSSRANYNKNECRYGDGRAALLDYYVVCGDSVDVCQVESGSRIDVYVKFKFFSDVANPVTGFSIKTIDGVLVYGTNTDFINIAVRPVKVDEVVFYKFSVDMKLASENYFFELGVSETVDGSTKVIDRRSDIFNIQLLQLEKFVGIAELNSTVEEIV